MAAEPELITVEVVYALPERQRLVTLQVPQGTSAWETARRSGLEQEFEGLVLEHARIGIFGSLLADPRTHVLQPGDRVEIYRALTTDPKQARKERGRKATRRAGAPVGRGSV